MRSHIHYQGLFKMNLIKMVEQFHRLMKFYPFNQKSVDFGREVSGKRIKLIEEETAELCEAIEDGDLVQILAESVDVVYVVLGGLFEIGITWEQFQQAFQLIHEANCQKSPPGDQMTKAGKPKTWKKANLLDLF